MQVTIRHQLPGRTRLDFGPGLDAFALQRLREGLAPLGCQVASASLVTGSCVIEHSRHLSADAVREGAATLGVEKKSDRTTGPSDDGGVTHDDAATMSPAELAEMLQSDLSGLGSEQALQRLARFGRNEVPPTGGRSPADMILRQLATAPVALLVGSAVLSIATGGMFDALITVSVVAINAVVGFVSEESTERLIRRLSRPIEHSAAVIRDGVAKNLSARDVAVGDVVLLTQGTVVPADARIIDCLDLTIDESMLTGESLPVEKSASISVKRPRDVSDRTNIVHAGTVVTGGDGRALVFRTGRGTEMAVTHTLLGAAHPPRPALEDELGKLSTRLTLGCIGISALVFAAGVTRGEPMLQMARSAIALAVAAIPEGLPAVATTTLALGARALEREGAFVRSLPAVESIGTIDTICLDKTGTLTANRMAVVATSVGDEVFEVDAAEGWHASDHPGLSTLARVVALSNEADLDRGTGSATELALLTFASELGYDIAAGRARSPAMARRNRNHNRHWMASEHYVDGDPEVLLKGAPDQLLELSSHWLTGGKIQKLDAASRARILETNMALAGRGLRLLGVARRDGSLGDGPMNGLVWVGLVALADPIRAEARDAVEVLHNAGVRTILITGDQAATGLSVARSLSLSRSGLLNVMEGWELRGLTDKELGEAALRTSVFARVSPADKLRIVNALQSVGRRVAMIGDGVNDGPALRQASVGIAMGKRGTDVAREVADIVIADDDLGRLAQVIARGRATEDNVRAAAGYLLATNLSEIGVTVVESLRGHGELETPMELFWLNLVTDIMPALGLALAEPRGGVMLRAPRSTDTVLFGPGSTRDIVIDGTTIAAAALAAHFIEVARAGPGPVTRSATFVTLAMAQIAYAWTLRDRSPGAGPNQRISDRRLEAMLLAAGVLLAVPFASAPLRRILGIAQLSVGRLGLSGTLSALTFLVSEVRRIRTAGGGTDSASQSSPPG